MYTDDCGLINILLKKSFSVNGRRKKVKYLPAILAISAELLEKKLTKNSNEYCDATLVECKYKDTCSKSGTCTTALRQFYIYEESHKLIFSLSEDLPDSIKISSAKLSASQTNVIRKKLDALEKESSSFLKLVDLEADIIMKYYNNRVWNDECPCPFENYVALLPNIFFFNPDILCCAIDEELKRKKKDTSVVEAIKTCIEFYILTDDIEKSGVGIGEQQVRYNNFHRVREIETTVLEQSENDMGEIKDRIESLTDAGATGLQYLCARKLEFSWNHRQLGSIIGMKNYRYIMKYCKTM